MEDVVYVIYFDGKRFESYSRRIAYLGESQAKQVITVEAKHRAISEYNEGYKIYRYYFDELPKVEQKNLVSKMKERFEIVHYTPNIKR